MVDDDPVNGRVLSRMVEMLGFRAVTAINGLEALQAVGAAEYDAILMDCEMPVMDGYEATRTIRAQERDRHVPIVAVTALSFPNERERCLEVGMDEFIVKPVMQGVLATVLEKVTREPEASTDVTDREIHVAPIDVNRARALETALGDEFAPVMASFCQSTSQRIDQVDVAVSHGEEEEIRRLVHSIRGSAKTFGCEGVAEAANLLSISLMSEDRTLWADAAWRLRTQHDDLKALLRDRFQAAGLRVD